jgi:transaldolase
MDRFVDKIEIFADGADIQTIKEYSEINWISGFTTNPTLMKKSGVVDYTSFASDVLKIIDNKSISFEVFADANDEMIRQAKIISKWGKNIFVKIPIVNSLGEPCTKAILELNKLGVPVNVTAIMTSSQVEKLIPFLESNTPVYLSVFAGRIADTGVDPEHIVAKIVEQSKNNKSIKIIWASPRELLNIYHAIRSGAHIITITKDILAKSFLIGKNLDSYSIETVKMFLSDSQKSGLSLD